MLLRYADYRKMKINIIKFNFKFDYLKFILLLQKLGILKICIIKSYKIKDIHNVHQSTNYSDIFLISNSQTFQYAKCAKISTAHVKIQ